MKTYIQLNEASQVVGVIQADIAPITERQYLVESDLSKKQLEILSGAFYNEETNTFYPYKAVLDTDKPLVISLKKLEAQP